MQLDVCDIDSNFLYLLIYMLLEAPALSVALGSVQGRKRGRSEGSWTMGK